MTSEEKLDIVSKELVNVICEVGALKDLVAMLLAELAHQSSKPIEILDQIIDSERQATYVANTGHEDVSEPVRLTMLKKGECKDSVFDLSRKILGRIAATRQ